MGILVYLAIGWGLMWVYREWLSTKNRKLRRRVKYLRNNIRDRIRWDEDILSEEDAKTLNDIAERAYNLREDKAEPAELEKFLTESQEAIAKIYPRKSSDTPRELIELLIVVFGVVMGIRALFLQPFKIPTGSMQPTLYGIHFKTEAEARPDPGKVSRFFRFLNFGSRYVNEQIEEDGELDFREAMFEDSEGNARAIYSPLCAQRHRVSFGMLKLFPYVQMAIGNQIYEVPGAMRELSRSNPKFNDRLAPGPAKFQKGEVLARGDLRIGDHLFVDRISYNFVDPKRGDIVVFTTNGITYQAGDSQGEGLSGLHYIKRLVGLPGETLKILNRELYVKKRGASEFVLLNGDEHKAFARMYSMKGGYRGYSYGDPRGAAHLLGAGDEFTLGENEYFMLGDNSENSADSRYWGVVPRGNIIGRALLVWWPLSRRWGPVDRAEPEENSTPPTPEIRFEDIPELIDDSPDSDSPTPPAGVPHAPE